MAKRDKSSEQEEQPLSGEAYARLLRQEQRRWREKHTLPNGRLRDLTAQEELVLIRAAQILDLDGGSPYARARLNEALLYASPLMADAANDPRREWLDDYWDEPMLPEQILVAERERVARLWEVNPDDLDQYN